MRTAIFVGLLRVAIAINPISQEAQNSLFWLIVAFIIADIVELVSKLTKHAPDAGAVCEISNIIKAVTLSARTVSPSDHQRR